MSIMAFLDALPELEWYIPAKMELMPFELKGKLHKPSKPPQSKTRSLTLNGRRMRCR